MDKPLVGLVTQEEADSGLVTTRRAQRLIGFQHPDSVRQAALAGRIERADRGLYNLASVLKYAEERRNLGSETAEAA